VNSIIIIEIFLFINKNTIMTIMMSVGKSEQITIQIVFLVFRIVETNDSVEG